MRATLAQARLLAVAVPAVLVGGALGSQYLGGLYPCEMCHWQRWPHYAAILVGLLAFVRPAHARTFVLLAALLIAASGAIGIFHAGVEYGWWEGLTRCAAGAGGGGTADVLRDLLATPIIRCDEPQWTLLGVSLAGFNAIFSLAGATLIALLAFSRPR